MSVPAHCLYAHSPLLTVRCSLIGMACCCLCLCPACADQANWGPGANFVQEDPSMLPGGVPAKYSFDFLGCAWGVSMETWRLIAAEFGYTIVARVQMLDLVWIRGDLVKGMRLPSWSSLSNYQLDMHAPARPDDLRKLMDYPTWRKTGSMRLAKAVALRSLQQLPSNNTCASAALRRMAAKA
jgi:hypothetical protein